MRPEDDDDDESVVNDDEDDGENDTEADDIVDRIGLTLDEEFFGQGSTFIHHLDKRLASMRHLDQGKPMVVPRSYGFGSLF